MEDDNRTALTIEVPHEALSAGVEVLCEFSEDRGIGYPELALGILQAILQHPEFPSVNLCSRPLRVFTEGVEPFTEMP